MNILSYRLNTFLQGDLGGVSYRIRGFSGEAFTSTRRPQVLSVLEEGWKEMYLREASPELQDGAKQKEEELEEVNIGTDEHRRPLFVNKSLDEKEKKELIDLLKEFRDVFTWSYDEIPRLFLVFVTHNLAVRPGVAPVKQAPRKFSSEIKAQIKKETKKLLKAKFIRLIQYLTWLANIILVKNKNVQIHYCVDFRDMNKACPKDNFPLPDIDRMVDTTASYERFSFMDGFSGYN